MTKEELRDKLLATFPIKGIEDRLIVKQLTEELKEVLQEEFEVFNEDVSEVLFRDFLRNGEISEAFIKLIKEL